MVFYWNQLYHLAWFVSSGEHYHAEIDVLGWKHNYKNIELVLYI